MFLAYSNFKQSNLETLETRDFQTKTDVAENIASVINGIMVSWTFGMFKQSLKLWF